MGIPSSFANGESLKQAHRYQSNSLETTGMTFPKDFCHCQRGLKLCCCCCCWVAKSCFTLWPHGLQHARLPCPLLSSGVCPDSCPLCWRCYLTIPSSAASFSFCLQSFPASGSFLMSWLFASGCQSIGASALATVLPVNIQDWSPLRLTGLISLLSKGLSRVFSNTTVQNNQFFSAHLSLWSNSHICTWLLKLWAVDRNE